MDIYADILLPAVNEINESLEVNQQIGTAKDAPLFGRTAPLDSLGLVNFIVLVEEKISVHTGKDIRLVNDKALSMSNSPFRDLLTLESYIRDLL